MPTTTGDVEIEIFDGGGAVVVVPAASVQLVIGPATSGTDNAIVATRSLKTLTDTFQSGPLPEAAALAILAGGTAVCIKAPTISGQATSVVTTTGSGTVSVSGTPNDEYYVVCKFTAAGTVGTKGIQFQLSLDAGRHFGRAVALGTASTFDIAGTGLQLQFSGTFAVGDTAKFGTTAPLTDTGGVSDALDAFRASQYAVAGVGSVHIVGFFSGTDLQTIQGYMESLTTRFVYNRAITELRDASPATVWGGTGEVETDWVDSLSDDVSALDAKRLCPCGGNYNMPTAFPTPTAGTPSYRRNLAWALAARQVQIPPQRHAGRVRDGALSTISVDPTNDGSDGFVYHDESLNPGLDIARVTSARLRVGLPGIYITNPNLASAPGSQFTLLPIGNVMDVACALVHQVGQQEINSDIRLNDNGTIFENEAQTIERTMLGVLNANMTAKDMISSARVAVQRDWNVLATSIVKISVTIFRRGYVLEEDISIGFADPFAAT